MHYTKFKFFKNTPLTNLAKSMNFESNDARDSFFDSGVYASIDYTSHNFNMVRDRLVVNIDFAFDSYMGINYCYFIDERSGVRYYCQVNKTEYVNERVTRFYLTVDVLMTFFQGDFANEVGYVNIQRQHLPTSEYNKKIYRLSCTDYLQATSPRIFRQWYMPFVYGDDASDDIVTEGGNHIHQASYKGLGLVFQCSADLESDFGDIDAPKFKASKGTIYDKVSSPVNIYYISMENANNLFGELSKYPWIEQNIKNIIIIPKIFIDRASDLESCDCKSIDANGLNKFKSGRQNNLGKINTDSISVSKDDFRSIIANEYGIDIIGNEPHLFNSNYFNMYVTNWGGAQLQIKPQLLPDFTLNWKSHGVIGYDNRIVFSVRQYNSNDENLNFDGSTEESGGHRQIPVPRGEYLGASLIMSAWDTMPIMIDNYKMSLANSAYDRKLTEENTFKGQWKMATGQNEDANSFSDRAFAALNLVGSLDPGTLVNNLYSEHNYYRQFKAQQEQAKIAPPTVMGASTGNALAIRNNVFGISVKLYGCDKQDLKRAYRYHKATGYEWNMLDTLQSVRSMSLVNYVQFDGDWSRNNVPAEFMTIAKSLFAGGVSLYHNPHRVANPFVEDIEANTRLV